MCNLIIENVLASAKQKAEKAFNAKVKKLTNAVEAYKLSIIRAEEKDDGKLSTEDKQFILEQYADSKIDEWESTHDEFGQLINGDDLQDEGPDADDLMWVDQSLRMSHNLYGIQSAITPEDWVNFNTESFMSDAENLYELLNLIKQKPVIVYSSKELEEIPDFPPYQEVKYLMNRQAPFQWRVYIAAQVFSMDEHEREKWFSQLDDQTTLVIPCFPEGLET